MQTNYTQILNNKNPKITIHKFASSQTMSCSSCASAPPRKMITLTSSDGQSFEIEESVALQSKTLEFTIEECGGGDDPIPLPNIKGNVLAKVVEYCNKHAQSDMDEDALKAWDDEFARVDHTTLFDLILASNFLEIKSLLDLTCQVVAEMIKGKTPEEIRKTFNINSVATAEEEEAIRRENQWAFE